MIVSSYALCCIIMKGFGHEQQTCCLPEKNINRNAPKPCAQARSGLIFSPLAQVFNVRFVLQGKRLRLKYDWQNKVSEGSKRFRKC